MDKLILGSRAKGPWLEPEGENNDSQESSCQVSIIKSYSLSHSYTLHYFSLEYFFDLYSFLS